MNLFISLNLDKADHYFVFKENIKMIMVGKFLLIFLSKLAAAGNQRKLNANSIPGMLKYYPFPLLSIIALLAVVQAQAQSGFISIDCGISENATYTDSTTSIDYVSDAAFIDTGKSKSIAAEYTRYNINQQLQNVRSFAEGVRNCYKIGLKKGAKYLIRAEFLYGNYDGQNKAPIFDLYLGSSKWETVDTINSTMIITKEIIHLINTSYIDVCLVNTGSGTPFMSKLELRPIRISAYSTSLGSLARFSRSDVGSTTNRTLRYADDVYDRIWTPNHFFKWAEISTSETIDALAQNDYRPPSIVMRTAGIPANDNEPMTVSIDFEDTTFRFLVYMHFAEILKLEANESRQFNISLNGEHWFGPLRPDYLYTTTVFSPTVLSGGQYEFSIYKTENSTLPPLLNAIEIYYILDLSQPQSNQEDVDAITNIKSSYGIKRNWQGDPCAPQAYLWEGLNCSYSGNVMPRIISLNLSSSGLTGEIPSSISSLTSLESLDLSNNYLTGSVPDFLSQLPSLNVLILTGNRLSGSVPPSLVEKSEQNLLVLSVGGNANLCLKSSCKNEKKNNVVVPVVASIAGVLIIISALAAILYTRKRRKQQAVEEDTKTSNIYGPLESKERQFTYSEILNITNNFERVLGKGGFGTVYHGYLDDTQVAVKILSPLSAQGYKEFHAEVKLLLRVHHRNLTSLVGFCNEGTKMGLIYEYMANGDLEHLLSGRNRHVLKWERRLDIAVEAAKGLEYLHNGCKPPIVHRDIKTANILLNDQFQARLADFGLSKSFPVEGGTHVSTVVAGTPGYLDPEYSMTNWLTEKSDVYSFGVVLLKIITGRPVIAVIDERSIHISHWVSSLVANGDIKTVIDPCLGGDFDINSVWKAVEVAMACTSPTSAGRPTMNQVVRELIESLAEETARAEEGHKTKSIVMMTESTPLAR
ncbi:LRR receptor-like serine/threonine-protein kinase IOS1 isoform X2 [Ricinus communis]|uniref:LRR receptor-like serine/threonine-protein kinase IOS1 isoform X2 n=1 Tax=Ricinus communis TaxID=3988 RepID=UPI00201ACC4A|nr:LRR receptor-like serine/threonine-protein kinase IOS1 isoform X2 [Ricinus communis]